MKRHHRQCLANIGRLERELFPDLPEGLRWAPWPPQPITVNMAGIARSNYTQIFEVWPDDLPVTFLETPK